MKTLTITVLIIVALLFVFFIAIATAMIMIGQYDIERGQQDIDDYYDNHIGI